MANKQQIQQCVTDCTNAANMLRSTADNNPKASIREMLTEGAGHIEMCIRQCENAAMEETFTLSTVISQPFNLKQIVP